MKLDIDATLERLTSLQRQMGVTAEPELPAADVAVLRSTGHAVAITELPTDREGILKWRGQVVVLYIRDQYAWDGQVGGYRFHVAECSTIENMRLQGRGRRYVVTNRSDGTFPVRPDSCGEPRLLPMSVCKNCLARLDWDGSRSAGAEKRARIITSFDISNFFSTYQNARKTRWLEPKGTAPTAPPSPNAVSVSGKPETKALPPAPPLPVVAPPPAGPEHAWALSIADAQFRQVALHIHIHGSISESEVHAMVDGARRARRFGLSLEEWFGGAPFRVEVRSVVGVKSYYRIPR